MCLLFWNIASELCTLTPVHRQSQGHGTAVENNMRSDIITVQSFIDHMWRNTIRFKTLGIIDTRLINSCSHLSSIKFKIYLASLEHINGHHTNITALA